MAAKTVEFNQALVMEEDQKFECIYNEFLKDYKIIMLGLTIVNRGEWLGRAARLFEVGYCSPFWVVT